MDILNRDNVNRVLIVALLLIWVILWAAAIVIVLVSPTEATSTADNVVRFLDRNNTIYTRLMFTVLGVVFILVGLLLLVAEVAPSGLPAVRLSQVAGGTVLLATQAIVQRLKYEVEHLEQVGGAKPEVKTRGKTANVRIELRTAPDANILRKTEEVCEVIRQVAEEMGVKLDRPPTVYIHPEPLLVPLSTREAEAITAQSAPVVQEPKAAPALEVTADVEAKDTEGDQAEKAEKGDDSLEQDGSIHNA